jgi:hypothetical protein
MNTRFFFVGLLVIVGFAAGAQPRPSSWTVAVTNHQAAYLFSRFGSLFTKDLHPGVDFGCSFTWEKSKSHEWFQAVHAGYFFHRFVQHAFPIYTQLGYRRRLMSRWNVEAALGGGYLHSIPAVALLKLNANGDYENGKGLGRGQAMVNLGLGLSYKLPFGKKQTSLFLAYQQQLQTPFINSYVPLLPYNGMALGLRFHSKK